MTPQEIARWMRREHLRIQELDDALRQMIATVPRGREERWISDLRNEFEKFRAHCCKHFAMEEKDGYLLGVLERRPTLSSKVTLLEHHHQELMWLMNSIWNQVVELGPADHIKIRDCRDRIRRFLSFLEEHEKDENALVSYVFTQEEGTKD